MFQLVFLKGPVEARSIFRHGMRYFEKGDRDETEDGKESYQNYLSGTPPSVNPMSSSSSLGSVTVQEQDRTTRGTIDTLVVGKHS